MKFYWLVIGTLVVWRITHFLAVENGPWKIVVRVRDLAGEGFWGSLLDCFYCLSIWVAAPMGLWLGDGWRERVLLWLSFSAGAILLERVTKPSTKLPLASFIEEPEKGNDHVLLRKDENPSQTAGHSVDPRH